MKFIPAFTLLSTLAAGVAAAPVSLGDGLLGLDLSKLNACLFADLTKLSLKPNTALDVKSNTCISIDKCLSVKTQEVVLKPVIGALIQVGQCQTKVCVAGQVLADTGVCVKACDTGRILDSKGICACAQGTIFANSKKLACIATSGCDLKLNTITGGVCLPKVCASGTVLNSAGVCVKSCFSGSILNDKGVCVCIEGSIFSNSKKSACIAISKCNLILNTITNGVCLPKTCATGQVLNSQGACVAKTCAVDRILDGQGVCVCTSGTIFSDAKKQVCIATGKCDLTLNTITKGVCLPKVCAAGKLLHSQLGLCIDASTCSLKVNGLCKEVLCPINKRLDANTGLCISLCAKGLLATPNKQCISVSACSPLLNNVTDGNCVPKTCTSKLLSINKEGICVCLPGLGLNGAGTCVTINASK